ncbi:MAG TPA: glycosyl transferase [Ruminococcaceae bacterium]|nr:glycosyl transferase [Oscillospiraceae bacterium]
MNKTIHYFWFGHGEKSALIQKCIASWQKAFPDFEIKEWNEENFDVRSNLYISQAYDAKKYAFVSDYARFKVLYEQGGLYFDTDVEVIAPFYDLLEQDAIAAFEDDTYVAPGLILWAKEPGNELFKTMMDLYENMSFLNEDGTHNIITICKYFTAELQKHGLKKNDGTVQLCAGFSVYPPEYFCPFNDLTGVMKKTKNTKAIHWYAKTWLSKKDILRNKITRILHRFLGVNFFHRGEKG